MASRQRQRPPSSPNSSSLAFPAGPAEETEVEMPDFTMDEPREEDLLRELAELGGGEELLGEGAVEERDFRMIRAGPVEVGDYNVDNVALTAEDENDPELLAEFASMLLAPDGPGEAGGKEQDGEGRREGPRTEVADDADSRSGKGKVIPPEPEATAVEHVAATAGTGPSPSPQDEVQLLRQLALEAKQGGDMAQAREYMAQIMQLEGRASTKRPSPTRDLIVRLGAQMEQCRSAARTLLAAGDKAEAANFLRREKALECDVGALRRMSEADRPLLATATVPIELPLDNQNREVGEATLLIRLNNFAVAPKAKAMAKVDMGEPIHLFALVLEWPPQAHPSAHRRMTSPMTIDRTSEAVISWPGVQRDLRTAKFFEHHKLKVEWYRREASFFRTKQVLVGSATLRMGLLVNAGKMEERIEFVDENRRPLGVSASIVLRTRTPLSPRAPLALRRTVEWTIWTGGEAGRIFNVRPVAGEGEPVGEMRSAEEQVRDIVSYVVLEEEIRQVKADPASVTDPSKLALLMALEDKLEQLMVAVDLGQLSMDEYLQRVRGAIAAAKRSALEHKRAGSMAEARRWLHRLRLMEEEIAEAADGAGGADGAGDRVETHAA